MLTIPISEDEYILVNTHTGAVDSVDRSVVEFLENVARDGKAVPASGDEENVSILSKRGYLTEKTVEEEMNSLEELFRLHFENVRKCKNHKLIVTYNCNLRCKYCYETNLKEHGSNWLERAFNEQEVDAVYNIITTLDAKCEQKTKIITLYGGEPLLPQNMQVVMYIMQKGLKLGYRFRAITNGVSLREYAPDLKKEGLDKVQVTLDGLGEIHDKRRCKADGTGTFDEIVEGIDEARKAGIMINLRITLDPSNFDNVKSLLDFIVDRGWHQDKNVAPYLAKVWDQPRSEYSPIMPWDEAVLKMIDLVASSRDFRFLVRGLTSVNSLGRLFFSNEWYPHFYCCEANSNSIFYDPHGNMYTCWESVGQEEHSIGKFRPKIEFNENSKLWLSRNIFNVSACRSCKYATLCGGGCPIRAYYKTGSIMSPNCEGIQKYIDTYITMLYKISTDMKRETPQTPQIQSVHQ
jgi:uncharacterized protein